MIGEKWLSDDGVIDLNTIENGKLNIIEAPCGSGKTTFVEKVLKNITGGSELLYLIDTVNGKESFNYRGCLKCYEGHYYYKQDGITAMTYATFAALCEYKPDEWLWGNDLAVIVCDELQSAVQWSKIKSEDINLHKKALDELHKRIDNNALIIAISATPTLIRSEFKDKYIDIPINGNLMRYTVGKTVPFTHINNIIPLLPLDKKGLIYTPHIKTMMQLEEDFLVDDIEAVAIWSVNNECKMFTEVLDVRDHILRTGMIPDDVQILIINAASQTSINIKSDIDYVVVNSMNEDTVKQVLGRVRHDIDTAYLLSRDNTDMTIITSSMLDDKWLWKNLYNEDKDELCKELNIRDRRGRLFGWTNVKRSLKYSEYKVSNKHTRTGDYSVISL